MSFFSGDYREPISKTRDLKIWLEIQRRSFQED